MRAEEVEGEAEVVRLAVGQPQRDHAGLGRAARAARGAQRRSACVANTSWIVSLNCRTLANPARERDVGDRQVGGLEQHARGLRALGAGQRERPGADLGDQRAVHLPLGVAEPPRQAGHAVAIDDAVADQAQRPADEIAAHVPLRRAGRGVRTAPLAGAVAGALRRGRARVEA